MRCSPTASRLTVCRPNASVTESVLSPVGGATTAVGLSPAAGALSMRSSRTALAALESEPTAVRYVSGTPTNPPDSTSSNIASSAGMLGER